MDSVSKGRRFSTHRGGWMLHVRIKNEPISILKCFYSKMKVFLSSAMKGPWMIYSPLMNALRLPGEEEEPSSLPRSLMRGLIKSQESAHMFLFLHLLYANNFSCSIPKNMWLCTDTTQHKKGWMDTCVCYQAAKNICLATVLKNRRDAFRRTFHLYLTVFSEGNNAFLY